MTQTHSLLKTFVIAYDDSSFTDPHSVLRHDEAQDPTGRFTHMGAYYEGWEDKRGTGVNVINDGWAYDYSTARSMEIGLVERANITHVDISTKWFTGNNVPEVSIAYKDILRDDAYHIVVERESLNPDSKKRIELPNTLTATHVKILSHQEGGIARIHVHGEPSEIQPICPRNLLQDAFLIAASNEHYGSPLDAVQGVRAENYMKGWESARSGRGEYALFSLQNPTTIQGLVIDTYLHRLNPVRAVAAFGIVADKKESATGLLEDAPRYRVVFADGTEAMPNDLKAYMNSADFKSKVSEQGMSKVEIKRYVPDGSRWQEILPQSSTMADQFHFFKGSDLTNTDTAFTHLLLQHGPNGGMHGLKAYGGLSSHDVSNIHAIPFDQS